jgi:hypothetical protein
MRAREAYSRKEYGTLLDLAIGSDSLLDPATGRACVSASLQSAFPSVGSLLARRRCLLGGSRG